MRDYAKGEPKMWHGRTFKALRKDPKALIVSLYLMTSPSSNMLGLFAQPLMYMAYETGLGIEGATEGLRICIEEGYCSYDEETEFVWVHTMAGKQIAPELKATDLRCKGVQKEYDSLPDNPFLEAFFLRYQAAFHLTTRRVGSTEVSGFAKAPSKPLRSQEQEQEQEQDQDQEQKTKPSASSPASLPTCQTQKIVDLYHEVLPELPKVRLMGTKRARAIATLWKWVLTTNKPDGLPRAESAVQALAWFREYFERASANDFLMGRGQRSAEHANWECDIDFLMTDKGLKQVIEKTRVPA